MRRWYRPLLKTKTANAAAGQRTTVNFPVPIDQNMLDLIEAATGDCRARSSITGTYGTAR